MTGTCKTCQHWEQDGPTTGPCAVFAIMPLPRYENLVDVGTYPFPLEKPLRTPPTFGCVEHQPKDGQK